MKNSSEMIAYHTKHIRVRNWHGAVAGIAFFTALKYMAVTPAQTFVYFNF
ncbi:hypothetical protein [Sulfurimonas sp. NW9]